MAWKDICADLEIEYFKDPGDLFNERIMHDPDIPNSKKLELLLETAMCVFKNKEKFSEAYR